MAAASRITGVPVRTIREWANSGKLEAAQGAAGRVVLLSDVERLAASTGRAYGAVEDVPPPDLAAASPPGRMLPSLAPRQDTAIYLLLAAMQEAHREQLSAARADADGRLAALREAHEREREALVREQAGRVDELHGRLEELAAAAHREAALREAHRLAQEALIAELRHGREMAEGRAQEAQVALTRAMDISRPAALPLAPAAGTGPQFVGEADAVVPDADAVIPPREGRSRRWWWPF